MGSNSANLSLGRETVIGFGAKLVLAAIGFGAKLVLAAIGFCRIQSCCQNRYS
jgi:hypothetical protein